MNPTHRVSSVDLQLSTQLYQPTSSIDSPVYPNPAIVSSRRLLIASSITVCWITTSPNHSREKERDALSPRDAHLGHVKVGPTPRSCEPIMCFDSIVGSWSIWSIWSAIRGIAFDILPGSPPESLPRARDETGWTVRRLELRETPSPEVFPCPISKRTGQMATIQ